jgi:DNA recombination-dependent growth factor C
VGFFSASISFTRYRLATAIPDSEWAEIPGRLKAHAFRDIDTGTDERSFGWTCFEDMLDTSWKGAPPEKGAYLAFGLRLDTRRIAPAVMKKHLTLALEAYKATITEQGRKGITKEEKEEIRDQVRLKLMARSLPVPAVFDVVWNTRTGTILLGSTRDKIQEMFEEIFFHTFGVRVLPLVPYLLALQSLPANRGKKLEEIEGTVFA